MITAQIPPIVWVTQVTTTYSMGELRPKSPILWLKTPIVWVPFAYTMGEYFTHTMGKVPLQWVKFTSTMAQSTSTMAQYHLYYGPIDPYYGSIELYYGSFSPTRWLPTPDFAIQSPSPHPSPGYTETKSAVPRKRISDNNPTRETYKQAHPATHRDSGSLRQSPSDIAARAQAATGARKTLDTHATQKWNAIIVK